MLTAKQERLLVSGLGLLIVFEYLRRYPPPLRLPDIALPLPEKVAAAATTLALLLLVTACSWGLGRGFTRLVRLPELRTGERALWQIAIGNLVLSYGVLLLGSLHLLVPQILITLLLAPVIGLAWDVGRQVKARRGRFPSRPATHLLVLGSLAVVLLAKASVDALWPEPGWDGLTYHLALAERYLFANDIATNPFHMASVFPQNMEMLYVFALGLDGPVLAKLLHFQFGLLTIWAVHAAAARFSARASLIAPICLVANPLFLTELSWAYNDLSNACYAFLAVMAASKPKLAKRDLFFAGLFAGACAGSRYAGAMIPIGLCLALVSMAPRPLAANARICAWIGGMSLTLLVPWLVRNWVFTGNPVSPMFQSVFHVDGAEYFHPIAVAQYQSFIARMGMGRGVVDFLIAPWNATMETRPGFYNNSFGYIIGPLHLVGVVASLLCGRVRRDRVARLLLRLVFIWFAIWFATAQEARFLAPLFPLTSLLAAIAFDTLLPETGALRRPRVAWALMAIPLLALAAEQVRSLDKFAVRYGNVFGELPLPSADLNRAADFIRGEFAPTDRLLLMFESRGFAFHGIDYIPYFTSHASPVLQVVHASKDVPALHCKVAELGVTHVLVHHGRLNRVFVDGYQVQDYYQDLRRIKAFVAWRTKTIWRQERLRVTRVLPAPSDCADGPEER